MIEAHRRMTFEGGDRSLTWVPGIFDGIETALLGCPIGHDLFLSNHEIAEDGMVMPRVACPINGCIFDEFVKLVGWEDRSVGQEDSESYGLPKVVSADATNYIVMEGGC